jgi:hypothetical protein
MAYGHERPHKIADPLCEPLWGGRRVLIELDFLDVSELLAGLEPDRAQVERGHTFNVASGRGG